MIIKTDKTLADFDFWAGAVYHTNMLNVEDFDAIEDTLTELYPDGMTETEINDMFWFEEDFIKEAIGYKDEEEEEEEEEDEEEGLDEEDEQE